MLKIGAGARARKLPQEKHLVHRTLGSGYADRVISDVGKRTFRHLPSPKTLLLPPTT